MKAWAPKTVFPHPWKATGVGSAAAIKGEIDSSEREACYTRVSAKFAKE
jgi:hypothetical protein